MKVKIKIIDGYQYDLKFTSKFAFSFSIGIPHSHLKGSYEPSSFYYSEQGKAIDTLVSHQPQLGGREFCAEAAVILPSCR